MTGPSLDAPGVASEGTQPAERVVLEVPAPPSAGLPTGTVARLRADVQTLVGHLELLQGMSLSRLQDARLTVALETARGVAEVLSGTPPADVPGDRAPADRQPVGRVAMPPSTDRPPAPSHEPLDPAEVAGLQVLIVDDDPINLRVAQSMLRVLGVDAETAADGAQALAMCEATPFDLILMDVMLPTTTGMAVTRTVRERYGRGPFVVGVTAMLDAEQPCLDAGMDAFYQKPLRIAQVSEAVQRCLDARASAG